MRGVQRLVESFSDEASGSNIKLAIPYTVEASNGEGLGPIVSADEGKSLLRELAVAR